MRKDKDFILVIGISKEDFISLLNELNKPNTFGFNDMPVFGLPKDSIIELIIDGKIYKNALAICKMLEMKPLCLNKR